VSAIASAVVCAVKFVNSFARWLKSIRIFSHILLLVYVLFCPKRNNFTSNFIEIRSIFLRRERNNICHGTEHGTEVATDKTENILSNWAEFIGYWSAKKLILNSRFWSLKIFFRFLPRDAMHIADYAVARCPSATRRYSVEMANVSSNGFHCRIATPF